MMSTELDHERLSISDEQMGQMTQISSSGERVKQSTTGRPRIVLVARSLFRLGNPINTWLTWGRRDALLADLDR